MKKLCSAKRLKTLINELNRPAVSSQCISEKLLRKKLFVLQYTNIGRVKIFYVLHHKVALLARRCSELGTRNRHFFKFNNDFAIIIQSQTGVQIFLMIVQLNVQEEACTFSSWGTVKWCYCQSKNFRGTRYTINHLKTFRAIFNEMPVLLLILY